MEVVLSSLVYHNREYFVFQDVLPHLPNEKAKLADQHAEKYTSRIGLCKEWVVADIKKTLEDRHFIDASLSNLNLLFSGRLVNAKRLEELLIESFGRTFTLKVEQFTLTEESFSSNMFEWYFDPNENNGAVKKTKVIQRLDEEDIGSNDQEWSIINDDEQEKWNDHSEVGSTSSSEGRLSLRRSYKRRRSSFSNVEESQDSMETDDETFVASVSEAVMLRPRKKAKETTTVISSLLESENSANTTTCDAREKSNCKSSPSTTQKDSAEHDNIRSTPSNSPNESSNVVLRALPNPSQNDLALTDDNQTTPAACQDEKLSSPYLSSPSATMSSLQSSLLGNSSTFIQTLKLSEQELCLETDYCDPVTSSSLDLIDNQETTSILPDELERPPCDGNINPQKDCDNGCDHNAQVSFGNNSGSTLCLCTNQEQNKQAPEKEDNKVTEASDLLDGLIAAGFVPHVRELLENIKSSACKDTKVSQMEHDLKTLRTQIQAKKRMNQHLEINVKKKARELEKLFENLRKGKAHCEMLEKKYKDLEREKSKVDAKLKKCLDILNSVD